MGSFRLAAGRLHHHKHFNFAESRVETVWPSLRHSCRSELTRQGISLSWSWMFPNKLDYILSVLDSFVRRWTESSRPLLPSDARPRRSGGERLETSGSRRSSWF